MSSWLFIIGDRTVEIVGGASLCVICWGTLKLLAFSYLSVCVFLFLSFADWSAQLHSGELQRVSSSPVVSDQFLCFKRALKW